MKKFFLVLTVASFVAACRGDVGSGNGSPRAGGDVGGRSGNIGTLPPPSSSCKEPNDIVLRNEAMVRLNKTQYENTVVAMLGDEAKVGPFPEEKFAHYFLNNGKEQGVSDSLVRAYDVSAHSLAKLVVVDKSKYAPCGDASDESACGEVFVASFGKKAFRRPLEDDEKERFNSFFASALSAHGYDNAVAMTAEAFLSSPQFLYRIDVGRPVNGRDGVRQLTDHEIASKLSYLLTDSVPDAELMKAADDGTLGEMGSVLEHATRLMNSPAGQVTTASFYDQWLFTEAMDYIDKDVRVFPAFLPDHKKTYRDAYRRFIASVVNEEGTLDALLTSKTTFADETLAKILGVDGVAGTNLERVMLSGAVGEQRGGLLTQPAWLAAMAHDNIDSPVLRGLFVYERFFCQTAPPVPAGVSTEIVFDATDRKQTARMMIEEQHESNATCRGCHRPFDAMGFVFGNYDAVGAWREMDAGFKVNATVTLPLLEDQIVTGAPAFAQLLSKSDDVKTCVATQWFRYGFGRTEEEGDACALQGLVTRFKESGGDLKDIWLSVVTSDSFRFRAPLAP